MKNIKYNRLVNEYFHEYEMDTGIKCYVVPKKGFREKQAMITVNYGSVNNEFEVNGKLEKMPSGIAHYLEHKLFEDKDVNVFDKFSKLGASVNAFTSFTSTAYYFNCTNNFEENLSLLLKFVQEPYFTEENVEKERGIISQEIEMIKDDPMWNIYINLLGGLYSNKYYKENIAGTTGSIKKITKDMLYKCYDHFYVPQNMAIICAGDIEAETVFKIAKSTIKNKRGNDIKPILEKEPEKVSKKIVKATYPVAIPMFYIGFKDNDFETRSNIKSAAIRVLIDILIGESSELYNNLYSKGLIDKDFTAEYIPNKYFSSTIISGCSKDYEQVVDLLLKEIEKLKKEKIKDEHFERIKNKHIGRFIRGFNSIDAIASGQVDYFSRNTDIFEALDSYVGLEKSTVEQFLLSHLKEESLSVYLILPEKSLVK